jgi:hypothetical protein
VSPSITNVIGE